MFFPIYTIGGWVGDNSAGTFGLYFEWEKPIPLVPEMISSTSSESSRCAAPIVDGGSRLLHSFGIARLDGLW
jgi:hypothetical protein